MADEMIEDPFAMASLPPRLTGLPVVVWACERMGAQHDFRGWPWVLTKDGKVSGDTTGPVSDWICQAAFGAPSEEEAIRHAGVDQLIPKLRQRFD